jgi:hypothetical protein
MPDLVGENVLKTPFEVIWQENDTWEDDDWASRHFPTFDLALEYFDELTERSNHKVWIGEIGEYGDHEAAKKAYFYVIAHNPSDYYSAISDQILRVDQLPEKRRGIRWYDDAESQTRKGAPVLVDYRSLSA